jgi:DNA-directed RNA polymerase sigma subunit (sigma70/sigma32)
LIVANKHIPEVIFHKCFYGYSRYKDDLCQEGYLAILERAQDFDETRGTKFFSFVYRNVYWAMMAAIPRDCFPVNLTGDAWQGALKVRKAREHLKRKKDSPHVTAEEIATHLGISVAQIKNFMEAEKRTHPVSLDAPVLPRKVKKQFIEMADSPDQDIENDEAQYLFEEIYRECESRACGGSERKKYIFKNRIGTNEKGDEVGIMTHEEIAKHYNVKRQSIQRQEADMWLRVGDVMRRRLKGLIRPLISDNK